MPPPPRPLVELTPQQVAALTRSTLSHYEQHAADFFEGTKDHDVSQNVEALLRQLPAAPAQRILDLGCGPGRDLETFIARGHVPVGLDGAPSFVAMARTRVGCEVWQQDLLALQLPPAAFDGVFANAVLFHVPTQELSRVLNELRQTLVPGGVLFCSNPRGPDLEQQQGQRFGSYLTLETWSRFVAAAGFERLDHYFRPQGRPRPEQPWLATVWRAR